MTAAGQPATGAGTPPPDDGLGENGRKALEAERDARREAEKRAKAATDELEKIRTANLSAEEKREKRLADLEREQATWSQERQGLLLERAVERTASRLGFADPADALGLLDRSSLEFETDGTPKNLDRQLADLAKAKPYLLTTRPVGSPDAGLGGGRPTGGQIYSRAQLRDTKFFDEHRDDIAKAMGEGRIQG